MRRIEIVLEELERLTRSLNPVHLAQEIAFTVEAIGFNLGLARNSVSRDLNRFWNDGLVIRDRGRPVFLLHRQAIETLLGHKLDKSKREVQIVAGLLSIQENQATDSPFPNLIGYNRSLRDVVEKNHAAALYPHRPYVLLTGLPGVNETSFAELTHRSACERAARMPPPLVYLNCAEYARSPELLSSHLFGRRQGVFTGINESKPGLIEQADGGYLLPDEVYHLPYEGREKLFSILGKGEYRPLGSNAVTHSTSARLIYATTGPVSSALPCIF